MASPTHLKTWTTEQTVPEYKVLHQFNLQLSCNTLKVPAIISFGRNAKSGEYFLEREFIEGNHPTNPALVLKAYSKLAKKMPKALRQSTKLERSAWAWVQNQLNQYKEPSPNQTIIKARTYLSLKENQPEMQWTHTAFLPENLIQNDKGIYLINFRHIGYRPQLWGTAQIINHFSQTPDSNTPQKILYNLIALALLQTYRKPEQNALQWLDVLLNLANA